MCHIAHSSLMRPARHGLAVVALLLSTPIWAESNHWAISGEVAATHIVCGAQQLLMLRSSSTHVVQPPPAPGCSSTEEIYKNVNVAKELIASVGKGTISEPNVHAAGIACGNKKGNSMMILGTAGQVEQALRQYPVPRACSITLRTYSVVTSVGSLAFTNFIEGGTMTIAESLAMHAKERAQIIAECDASPACRAELARLNAVNSYHACMRPTEITHTCIRPW